MIYGRMSARVRVSSRGGGLIDYHTLSVSTVVNVVECDGGRYSPLMDVGFEKIIIS